MVRRPGSVNVLVEGGVEGAPRLSFDMPRRGSRAEAAAGAVESRIIKDGLTAGFRLGTRADLVGWLGVAPSTVSEAIKLLEDRGRVTTKTGPGGGVFVAEPGVTIRLARSIMSVSGSATEVADALEVRNVLEPAVIVNAAEAAHSKQDLKGVHRAMRALRGATNTAEYFRCNLDFHAEVAALCSNDVLRRMYCGLLEIVQSHDPMLALLSDQDQRAVNARRTQVHQDIADAIASGDVTSARAAARAHGKQLAPRHPRSSRTATDTVSD